MKYLLSLGLLSFFILSSCSNTEETPATPDNTPATEAQVVEVEDTVESDTDDSDNQSETQETGVEVGGAMMLPSKDIVDNAVEASNVTTLVAAVQAAGLVETLKSDGPFTVFAPTNDAFDNLDEWVVDTLLLPENKTALTSVLTYHVVAGSYTSSDLEDGQILTSVQWENLIISYENDIWMINWAEIQIADVISSNGVTHVIDSVLLPEYASSPESQEQESDDA